MDRETLLALLEKNQGVGILEPVDLGPLDNSPEMIARIEEFKQKFFRPECFPPGFRQYLFKQDDDQQPKD